MRGFLFVGFVTDNLVGDCIMKSNLIKHGSKKESQR